MGLVMKRTQEVRSGFDIYSVRCACNSYGDLCREPYDPVKHQGEGVVIDPRDKKRWAERQVHWLIKQVSLQWALISSTTRTYDIAGSDNNVAEVDRE